MKAVPNAARVAAYRFGMSIRLMRNICLWKDILALPVLEKLVLDQLLSGQVLPHIENIASDVHDAITRTERIISSLSGVWAGPSVTGERRYSNCDTPCCTCPKLSCFYFCCILVFSRSWITFIG